MAIFATSWSLPKHTWRVADPPVRPRAVAPPADGLWRIGRGDDPLRLQEPSRVPFIPLAGNRFDSASGSYRVLYFGTSLECCFGETLARFRPSPSVIAVIADEWRERGFMQLGAVPAEWRHRRSAVRVSAPSDACFLDVEHVETHQHLRTELALGISALGLQDLDVAAMRGPDRRVTRLVGEWTFDQTDGDGRPRYAGLRYLSRVNSDWECWAVFTETTLEVKETRPITLDLPGISVVERLFELTVH